MHVNFDVPTGSISVLRKNVGKVAVLDPPQKLGHNVFKIVFSTYVLKLHHPLIDKVPDQVIREVNVRVPLVGHQVAGHGHGSLIVQEYMDGYVELCKLIRKVKHARSVFAGIRNGNMFSLSG